MQTSHISLIWLMLLELVLKDSTEVEAIKKISTLLSSMRDEVTILTPLKTQSIA